MPAEAHLERLFRTNDTVSDIIKGIADNLTVLVGGLAAGVAFLLARLTGSRI